MAQIFKPKSNTIHKVVLVGIFLFLCIVGLAAERLESSSYATRAREPVLQPVPFSHKHHVRGLGLDCRYCHTSVERSAEAGMPPTHVCMTCHSQLWTEAGVLKPVRDSFKLNKPIQWNRVTRLPDFVYFRHDIHIAKGISCVECHGHVENMPLTMQVQTFHMTFCLNCHRHPENYVRPLNEVFNMDWNGVSNGEELVKQYHIDSKRIINCTTCHR